MRFERSVGEKYVSGFVSEAASYCELAWGDDDGDMEDAAASISRAFRAVSKAAIEARSNLLALHQQILQPGLALDLKSLTRNLPTPAHQIRSEQKRLQIEALMTLFALIRQRCADDWSAICVAYRALRLGFPLPTPHSLQYALF